MIFIYNTIIFLDLSRHHMATATLCPKVPDIFRRVFLLRKYVRLLLDHFCMNSMLKPRRYQPLQRCGISSKSYAHSGNLEKGLSRKQSPLESVVVDGERDFKDSDLVAMKISLLGDRQIGKTSFLAKYMGDENDRSGELQMGGLNYINKVQYVKGARLFFNICEVEGEDQCRDQVLAACKDSVAILFMFDLTSRCTLNGVIKWYQEASKWNQTAIPIIIGTKFDDFVQLPIDLQYTIASQARSYAKALNATLFFSSSTYNINVNKVFKFITAKLFNLPWSVERNLTVGEPIIDF